VLPILEKIQNMGNVTLYGFIGFRIMVADGMGKFGVMFKEIMPKLSIMPRFFWHKNCFTTILPF